METAIVQKIRNAGLRATPIRIEVLRIFEATKHVLSSTDILDKITVQSDRVSVFRILNAFEEAGILHTLPNQNGTTLYGLCADTCSKHGHVHQDAHAHFTCNQCKNTFCISLDSKQSFQLPNYQVESAEIILKGTCPNCIKS
jgi:Fur family ferric uptake transcriptional regulator